MEVTKWLKPSDKRVTKYGDSASVQAVTRVNAGTACEISVRRASRINSASLSPRKAATWPSALFRSSGM